MTEESGRFCSTRNALSDMLRTASRRLEKALSVTQANPAENPQNGLEKAKASVEDLTARLAHHRELHGC